MCLPSQDQPFLDYYCYYYYYYIYYYYYFYYYYFYYYYYYYFYFSFTPLFSTSGGCSVLTSKFLKALAKKLAS